jgi:rhodanese-related sulfurtransferase
MFAVLDRTKDYIAYCQSGRRSAAAAFLFAQRGFKVWLLDGGLKGAGKPA